MMMMTSTNSVMNFLTRRLSSSSYSVLQQQMLPSSFYSIPQQQQQQQYQKQFSRNGSYSNNVNVSWTKMVSGSRGINSNTKKTFVPQVMSQQGGDYKLIYTSKKWISSSTRCSFKVLDSTKNLHQQKEEIINESKNRNDPEEDFDKPHVVYEGALSGQLKRVKIFSMITSVMGLSMQSSILNSPDTQLAATIAMLGMVGFFTYVTPFLIHQLSKKYVTEIIYNPQDNTYTAVRYTFFLRRNELTFCRDQIVVPDVPGPFTTALVLTKDGKKTPLFFALESFKYPEHYGLLMGYDKPLDLHITSEDVQEALNKKHQQQEKLKRKEK